MAAQERRYRTGSPSPPDVKRVQVAPAGKSPISAAGRLAELQRSVGNAAVLALLGEPAVQRDDTRKDDTRKDDSKTDGSKKTAGTAGVEVVFVIRKKGDVYTAGMAKYARTTLRATIVREVGNIEDMAAAADAIARSGTKISKLSIVGHGQTTIGGVGMTPSGEKSWRYVRPDEVRKFVDGPTGTTLRSAMATGAQVEFWGCYLGGIPAAGAAWADLLGTSVRSSKGEMHVVTEHFIIGKNTWATSSTKVPNGAKQNFTKFLLRNYKAMLSTGEAPKLTSEQEKIEYMTKLFDAGGGELMTRVITEKGSRTPHGLGSQLDLDLMETSTPSTP